VLPRCSLAIRFSRGIAMSTNKKAKIKRAKAKILPINSIKISGTTVSKIPLPDKGKITFHWDSELKGFCVKATSTCRYYMVQKRTGGRGSRNVKYVIATDKEIAADEARRRAARLLADIGDGVDVYNKQKQEEKQSQVKGLTLAQAYNEFKASRELRPRTIQTYDENINRCLKDWLDLPLGAITPELVLKRHKQISTAGRNGRGVGSANQAMRFVRVIFNYVIATKNNGNGVALIDKNPVGILNQLDSWNELEERDTTIHADDLADWYQAVMGLESDKLRDFFLFLIFSGLRRNEAMRLKWEHFDTKTKTLTIPKELSKTKKTRKIPLTDVLLSIYRSRKAKIIVGNPYVFQGMHSRGHLTEPKRGVNLVRDKSGINWSSHDLRRSYVTLANRLDVSAYKVKFHVQSVCPGFFLQLQYKAF